jgi:hypothetical protein
MRRANALAAAALLCAALCLSRSAAAAAPAAACSAGSGGGVTPAAPLPATVLRVAGKVARPRVLVDTDLVAAPAPAGQHTAEQPLDDFWREPL